MAKSALRHLLVYDTSLSTGFREQLADVKRLCEKLTTSSMKKHIIDDYNSTKYGMVLELSSVPFKSKQRKLFHCYYKSSVRHMKSKDSLPLDSVNAFPELHPNKALKPEKGEVEIVPK